MTILYFGDRNERGRKIMTQLAYECPLCKERLANPNELRSHRSREHKNVFYEIKAVA
jgi:hypothetical protein